MKLSSVLLAATLSFSLFSCKEKKETKAFKAFNEGVALSLQSGQEQDKGNFEKADALNKQSIKKFQELFLIDSTHAGVRSALGHCLYIDKQYQEAIKWFEQANKVNGEMAANYQEMGLCKINIGQIGAGKEDIDKAFVMDTSKDIRELTMRDLTDIAELAFQYSDDYANEGDVEKGTEYKKFSIGVFMLAFEYDKSRKDIASKISTYAEKIGDKETAAKYKESAESLTEKQQ